MSLRGKADDFIPLLAVRECPYQEQGDLFGRFLLPVPALSTTLKSSNVQNLLRTCPKIKEIDQEYPITFF